MRVRKDQKGFTVVEVLIASAILAIVVLTVCAFILVGSRSYAAGNSDISVQQEAQLALNQMSDVLIDTTRSVNYAGYDASGNAVLALKDAEFTFTPEDKSLIMYNGVVEETAPAVPGGATSQTVDSGNGNKHYHFYWSKENETLYYAELEVQSTDVDTSAIHFPAFDPADPVAAGWVELASHVTDFSVDLSQVEEKRVVQLALTFVDGRKEYVTSNNVTIRNKVGVNDAELAPLNKRKTLNVEARDSGVIIEPGEEYHFSTPKVTGENVVDRSVTWSLASSGSPSGGTKFTDDVNGILYVATDEPAGIIEAVITTNAVDSDGYHASCIVKVNIKRATSVALTKTADSNADNGPLQISPGCTFTISATVGGNKLGEVCSVCGDDTSIDKAVGYGSTLYPWHIHDPSAEPGATTQWNPTQYIDILENEPDHATFYVHPDVPTSDPDVPGHTYTVVIQAASLLSVTGNAYNRQYDPVFGGIELTFVKGNEDAIQIKGLLQYGDETVINEIKEDLTTEGHEYVTCIRVVDNSTVDPQPDKILLYFTIGHSADFRIVPDLFDLDLSRSYTFYMQALDPVSKENHKQGNHHQADSKQEIWNEYINHLSTRKPYGYVGDKYDYRQVYYSILEKPRAIWDGYEKGKDITFDPINIYAVGNVIIGNVEPDRYENIWDTARTHNRMTYSVYVGDGDKKDDWTPLYWYNGDKMIYEGSTSVADGAGKLMILDKPGRPANPSEFFNVGSGDRMKLCGNYHIVTGFCYDNVSDRTLTGDYDFIGWQGFSCDGKSEFKLPHELRHYTFDNGTIHVKITDDFTMEIKHSDFTGEAMFPLPKEMARKALFPNINSLDWQTTGGKLTVKALRDGNSWAEDLTFNYVRYHYIKLDNSWEVEPVRLEFRSGQDNILVHSYGIYKCGVNDTKWVCIKAGSTTEKDFTIQRFDYEGRRYRADFPLPSDDDFLFKDGSDKKTYQLDLYDSNMQCANNVPVFTVTCEKEEGVYKIRFRTEEKAPSWEPNNHKITLHYYGTYTWHEGQSEWIWQEGNKDEYTTDYKTNLEGVMINNTSYKMYFPSPQDSDFPFKNGVTEIPCTSAHVAYAMDDENCEKAFIMEYEYNVKYTLSGNTPTITFINRYKSEEYGTFKWEDSSKSWIRIG